MAGIKHLLFNTIQIYRPAQVEDGPGRFINSFVKIGTHKGRLSAMSAGGRRRGERDETMYTDVLYLEEGVDIARGDHIRRRGDGVEAVVIQIRTLSKTDHIEAEVRRTVRGPGTQELPED